jgi:hypothetical protein
MTETYSYKVERYFCRKCNEQWGSKQTADKCCEKSMISHCTRCSAKIDDTFFEYRAICEDCREFDRVKKAEIIEKCPDEGFFFLESNTYLSPDDWESELFEQIDEGDLCEDDLNGYFYLTNQKNIEIDLNRVLDQVYDHDSEMEEAHLCGVEDLDKAITVFNEKNGGRGLWFPDFSRIFIYDQKLFDEYLLLNSIYISPLDRALGVTRKVLLTDLGLGEKTYD